MAVNLNERRGEDDVMLDINTTPLIDVMLVLLIMLIVTIPPRTHAVNLEMPSSATPPATVEPAVVRLDIGLDGTMLWDGTPVPDRVALENRLRSAAATVPQPEIHVAPNALVKYANVAMVLAESQRLGIVKIGIVAGERPME